MIRTTLLLMLLPTGLQAEAPEAAAEFPGKTWAILRPEEAGLDPAGLRDFADKMGGRGCVVRRGRLVTSWGDISRRADIASAAKPWYVHLLLLLLRSGVVADFDQPVHKVDPRLFDLDPAGGFKNRGITWRHLANQTSCYGVQEKPGTAFDYSDYNMALFYDLLVRAHRADHAGMDEKVLRPRLTDLLRCEDAPTLLAFGPKDRPGRLAVSVRDHARFGLLYLRRGVWGKHRLLEADQVRLVIASPVPADLPRTRGRPAPMLPGQRSIGGGRDQTDHGGSYSFAWWINGKDAKGNRRWPDLPHDAYGSFGHGGKRGLLVLPGLDIVAAWNDARIQGVQDENRLLGILVEAARVNGRKQGDNPPP